MEGSKEPDYRFHKVYLYVPGPVSSLGAQSWGTAEIEVYSNKGNLRCVMNESPASKDADRDVSVLLFNESTGDTVKIGRLIFDQSGCGKCTWEFKTGSMNFSEIASRPVNYRIMIKADPGSTKESAAGWGGVLLEGLFSLESEARDSRVVGFKKEVKVKPACYGVFDKNPLFQRVEPFEPPIPNSVWWRISTLPGYGGLWTTGFCPRERKYGSGF